MIGWLFLSDVITVVIMVGVVSWLIYLVIFRITPSRPTALSPKDLKRELTFNQQATINSCIAQINRALKESTQRTEKSVTITISMAIDKTIEPEVLGPFCRQGWEITRESTHILRFDIAGDYEY